MTQTNLQYSTFDTCVNLVWKLNCDKEIDEKYPDPIAFCGFTDFIRRETVREIAAIEVPGSKSDKFCLWRPAKTVRDGSYLDLNSCGVTYPMLWAWMNQAGLWKNELGHVKGMKGIIPESECGECGKEGDVCKNRLAHIAIRTAWCGGKRHPDWDFVAFIHPCLTFEPQENSQTFGAGFNSGISFSASMDANDDFVDPFGFLSKSDPLCAPWGECVFKCDEDDPIRPYLNGSCDCFECLEVNKQAAAQLPVIEPAGV